MTTAESFAERAHRALCEVGLGGALSPRQGRIVTFQKLSAEARSIGLFDLADRLSDVAEALVLQDSLGDKPNLALANALLASFDRIEALGTELARMALLAAFGAADQEQP